MSDLKFISIKLQESSASQTEISLPYLEIISAINELKDQNIPVIAWEPWLIFPDGKKTHTSDVIGMTPYKRGHDETWDSYVKNSCAFAIESISQENMELEKSEYRKKYPSMKFYYCISINPKN